MHIAELDTIGMDILVEQLQEYVVVETTMTHTIEVVDHVQFIQAVDMVITMTMEELDVLEEVFTQIELAQED